MVVLGIDAHKRCHTVVAVNETGRKRAERNIGATTADHLVVLTWAEQFGADRLWAVEDCSHLSRRLERDLLGAGERIVRVPLKLMAHARDSARSDGKSDPIDAQAVARAALREPDLPTACLDGPSREVRLLSDHRDDLVTERTCQRNGVLAPAEPTRLVLISSRLARNRTRDVGCAVYLRWSKTTRTRCDGTSPGSPSSPVGTNRNWADLGFHVWLQYRVGVGLGLTCGNA